MSHKTYTSLWKSTMMDIVENLQDEDAEALSLKHAAKPERQHFVLSLYVRYVDIYRQLEDSYDQMAHPQKRELLRKVLESVMCRVLELKEELVDEFLTEYVDFDSALMDLHLTPKALEIPTPRFCAESRRDDILMHQQEVSILKEKFVDTMGLDSEDQGMSIDEALLVIQKAERARQGKLRFRNMKELKQIEENERRALEAEEPEMDQDIAAVSIQRMIRGTLARKQVQRMRQEEFEFIGMKESDDTLFWHLKRVEMEGRQHLRHQVVENKQDFEIAKEEIRERILEHEGPVLREEYHQFGISHVLGELSGGAKKFPEFKGTAAWCDAEAPPNDEDEELLIQSLLSKKKKKKKKKKKEEDKPKKSKSVSDYARRNKKLEEENARPLPGHSRYDAKNRLVQHTDKFREVWMDHDDESNMKQRRDDHMVRQEIMPEIEWEIRMQVDEALKAELSAWKKQFDKERKAKRKKKSKTGKGSEERE
eukprot:TRINITY_DN221_c2_g1_i3.p1 TRINITY_DN221_c2_g1~~TRINITY_DN221_c2_g1_i3.p1  ORF type:complete len:480 (-),score=161.81 TRINITY_DN221_c2_g1_i3:136-1575(-)